MSSIQTQLPSTRVSVQVFWSVWPLIVRHRNLHGLAKEDQLWRLFSAVHILNLTQIQQVLRNSHNFVFKFSMTENHFCPLISLFPSIYWKVRWILYSRDASYHCTSLHVLYKVFLRNVSSQLYKRNLPALISSSLIAWGSYFVLLYFSSTIYRPYYCFY